MQSMLETPAANGEYTASTYVVELQRHCAETGCSTLYRNATKATSVLQYLPTDRNVKQLVKNFINWQSCTIQK